MVLFLLTAAALLVHGYHPFAEDAEIYLPGIENILNPRLFPMGREFFASHASLTFFPNIIAFSLRFLHLPFELGIFLWHVASIFLLLAACRQLSGIIFLNDRARWAGICLVAALFTIPVAGTALYLMDQYLNPRNLAAFCLVFAVARCTQKKHIQGFVWVVVAACVHPLMWAFGFSLCALLWFIDLLKARSVGKTEATSTAIGVGCIVPFMMGLGTSTSPAYHIAAMEHNFHYLGVWQWYEWLGVIAPLALLWWFHRLAARQERSALSRLCGALVMYGLIFCTAAVAVDLLPSRFESLTRFQLLRSFHLVYMFLFLIAGGLAGEFVLKNHVWRWLVLFVPLSAGMFIAQRDLFPQSSHVEWPGETPRNPWEQAFLWARNNTPDDAVFALNPGYMQLPGEDEVGFRCLAQRSRLADDTKDSGAVSMFPPLAEEWWAQLQAQIPWQYFQLEDFERLKRKYGVTWVVLQQPVAGIHCAYGNGTVSVCQIP